MKHAKLNNSLKRLVCITSLLVLSFVNFTNALAVETSTKLAPAQELKYMGKDKFLLSGQYYAGADQGAGVLLLHDCSHDSKSYLKLGKSLASKGLHTLAVDFRGYGKSATPGFSHHNIKKNSKSILVYQNEVVRLTSYWEDDVFSAHNKLRTKVGKKKGIGVVASGCAVNYAVSLAEKIRVSYMVIVSPEMTYAEKERYKNLIDIPTYFVNSTDHLESFNTLEELFAWNGSKATKAQVFKGVRTGNNLLRTVYHIEEDIAQWLKYNLDR